ncbi:hypothetical protein HKCCE3408_17395 [Rhodobacterales bacterium HKCCE3408]|nr:hypothetical protein [Rhodobacterales bacterium HKCCE3408]
MTRTFIAAAIATLVAAPALADQYVAQIPAPFNGANPALLETLKVVEIDSFTMNGAHYIVIDAPDEGYVEAYFFANSIRPIAIQALEADWTAPGLSSLTLEQRLLFMSPFPCDYCLS